MIDLSLTCCIPALLNISVLAPMQAKLNCDGADWAKPGAPFSKIKLSMYINNEYVHQLNIFQTQQKQNEIDEVYSICDTTQERSDMAKYGVAT